jgi:hypothetical protein
MGVYYSGIVCVLLVGPVVQSRVSLTYNSKQTSQELVYKFGNISSEIQSGSVEVFFSEVLK